MTNGIMHERIGGERSGFEISEIGGSEAGGEATEPRQALYRVAHPFGVLRQDKNTERITDGEDAV
jgi:hypothetical protein